MILEKCLVCSSEVVEYENLGIQPLVNNLKNSVHEEELSFELKVNHCNICTHKQLSLAVDPQILFKNYLYKTGIAEEHKLFFKHIAEYTHISMGNKPRELLDIGCNDGSLMSCFSDLGWRTLGIEPADNLARDTALSGLHVINDFFPTKTPIRGKFDLITAFNVFAHNATPHFFLDEMAKLLAPGGKILILTTMAKLDNYYHEHVSYFSPLSMATLVRICGLELNGVREVGMHGKSLLFEITLPKAQLAPNKDMLKGLSGPFIGYGASANGIVLLNYLGLNLEYVVDDNDLKQNKYIPGVNTPIRSAGYLMNDERDLTIVILAYHLYHDIKGKIMRLRHLKHDRFVHPLRGEM